MKVEFARQYSIPCVVIEDGDTADDVLSLCDEEGAYCDRDPDGRQFCVKFSGRPREFYTETAIRRSLELRAARESGKTESGKTESGKTESGKTD